MEEMKKVVLKLDLHDDKAKQKAMKAVSSLSGIDSIAMDMKEKKLTVIGDVDPVNVVSKLREFWHTEIFSVGPAKEPEKRKDEHKKMDPKKERHKKMYQKKEESKKGETKKEEHKKMDQKKEGHKKMDQKKEQPKKEGKKSEDPKKGKKKTEEPKKGEKKKEEQENPNACCCVIC